MAKSVEISACAYAKIMLHGAKYSTQSVGGLLLGTITDSNVKIVDSLLVYHGNPVGPIFEVASAVFDARYSQEKSLQIVGIYYGHEDLKASGTESIPIVVDTLLRVVTEKNNNGVGVLLELDGNLVNEVDNLSIIIKKGTGKILAPDVISVSKLNSIVDQLLADAKHWTVFDVDDHMEGNQDCKNSHIDNIIASLS